MAEGRMLKRVISESKKLGRLKSDSARLLYTWLIPWLDVEGRHSADTEIIKGHVFPKVKTMSLKKISNLLDILNDANLIILYSGNGEDYLQFTKFHELQSIRRDREGDSKIPNPSKDSIITPGAIQDDSPLIKDKVIEEKLIKDKAEKPISQNKNYDKAFEEFWEAYPNKTAKQYAKEKFMILMRKGELDNIYKAFNGYMGFLKHKRVSENFEQAVMNPATFLNKDRWRDYIDFKYKARL